LLFAVNAFYGQSAVNTFYQQNIDGYYVTNENDTIKCKFEFIPRKFDELKDYMLFHKFLYSIKKKVTVLLENGEKKTFKPTDIKLFNIKKKDFEYYKFVSLKEDTKNFYEEVFTGKISVYYSHWSSDAPKQTYYLKDGSLYSRETNLGNFRNWIGKLIEDNPDLYSRWMDSDKYYQKKEVFDVIKIYNVDFLNKNQAEANNRK